MARLSRYANLGLLVAYPVAWTAPLLETGVVSWLDGSRISVLSGITELWSVDRALAAVVAFLAIAMPYAKVIATALIQFERLPQSLLPVVDVVGKLSMADVFLVALSIVVVKGVGIGHVTPVWGLWLFTGCVLTSIWVAHTVRKAT